MSFKLNLTGRNVVDELVTLTAWTDETDFFSKSLFDDRVVYITLKEVDSSSINLERAITKQNSFCAWTPIQQDSDLYHVTTVSFTDFTFEEDGILTVTMRLQHNFQSNMKLSTLDSTKLGYALFLTSDAYITLNVIKGEVTQAFPLHFENYITFREVGWVNGGTSSNGTVHNTNGFLNGGDGFTLSDGTAKIADWKGIYFESTNL